jgi:hypothetical protein
MIKRSAIVMLFFTLGTMFLLVYAAYHPGNAASTQVPVKCSGKCRETGIPVQWNIVSPTFFQSES